MQHEIALTLPYPPSINHYWRRVGARTILSRAARAFREQVAAIWLAERTRLGYRRIEGDVAVRIVAHPPDKRRRDLDNLLKAVLDAIEASGVIEDDAHVKLLHIGWASPTDGGRLLIEVRRMHHDGGEANEGAR